jgi:hypothetical protein
MGRAISVATPRGAVRSSEGLYSNSRLRRDPTERGPRPFCITSATRRRTALYLSATSSSTQQVVFTEPPNLAGILVFSIPRHMAAGRSQAHASPRRFLERDRTVFFQQRADGPPNAGCGLVPGPLREFLRHDSLRRPHPVFGGIRHRLRDGHSISALAGFLWWR